VKRPSPRFIRSILTSLLTTVLDFAVLTAMVELLHVNYVFATWLGTVVGSLSNFTINKHWAFKGSSLTLPNQFGRFLLVQAGASGWQTLGVWLLTRFGGLPYQVSKLIVAAIVALAWNYPMNRGVVFSHRVPSVDDENQQQKQKQKEDEKSSVAPP
jgi:putative flippase GtrA